MHNQSQEKELMKEIFPGKRRGPSEAAVLCGVTRGRSTSFILNIWGYLRC